MENKLNEIEIEKLRRIIEKYEKEENKKEYKERKEKNESYFIINVWGDICKLTEKYHSTDNICYELGNYYFTEEEERKELEKIKIRTKLKRLAERLNFEATEEKNITEKAWGNENITKRSIFIDTKTNKLFQDFNWRNKTIEIYCLNDKFLEKAIEEIGEDELKKIFL